MGNTGNEEAMHVRRQGAYAEISVPSPQFCCGPETALKNVKCKKKKKFKKQGNSLNACIWYKSSAKV